MQIYIYFLSVPNGPQAQENEEPDANEKVVTESERNKEKAMKENFIEAVGENEGIFRSFERAKKNEGIFRTFEGTKKRNERIFRSFEGTKEKKKEEEEEKRKKEEEEAIERAKENEIRKRLGQGER